MEAYDGTVKKEEKTVGWNVPEIAANSDMSLWGDGTYVDYTLKDGDSDANTAGIAV